MPEMPECLLEGKKRPFTGAEYVILLRDGREVYIYGEQVQGRHHPPRLSQCGRVRRQALRCATRCQIQGSSHNGDGYRFWRLHAPLLQGRTLARRRDRSSVTPLQRGLASLTVGWDVPPTTKPPSSNTLGANAEFYGKFADNARTWYARGPGGGALRQPRARQSAESTAASRLSKSRTSISRSKKRRTPACSVSGAKVVATNSALTHYNFLGQNMGQDINDESMVVMFMASMDTPGIKLICRPYLRDGGRVLPDKPWDYPLTGQFDENDAIFVFDNAFIPWENVFIHRDIERLKAFYPRSGCRQSFHHAGCTRLAVKLDFIAGLLYKAARSTGRRGFPGRPGADRRGHRLAQSALGPHRRHRVQSPTRG